MNAQVNVEVATELKFPFLFRIDRSVLLNGDEIEFERYRIFEAETEEKARILLHKDMLENFDGFEDLPDHAFASFEKLVELKEAKDEVENYLDELKEWEDLKQDMEALLEEYKDMEDYEKNKPKHEDYLLISSSDFELYKLISEKMDIEDLPFDENGSLIHNGDENDTASVAHLGQITEVEKLVLETHLEI